MKTFRLDKLLITLSFMLFTFLHMPAAYAGAARVDSANFTLPNNKQPVKTVKYHSYVDTTDCQETEKKIYAFVFGIGGGNLDQECPSNYPVLYKINHLVVYTTAIPYLGAAVGGGGHVQVVCCAIKHEWRT